MHIKVCNLQNTLANLYRLNKSICAKHSAALDRCHVPYHDKSESAIELRSAAKKRQEQHPKLDILYTIYPMSQKFHRGLTTLIKLGKVNKLLMIIGRNDFGSQFIQSETNQHVEDLFRIRKKVCH